MSIDRRIAATDLGLFILLAIPGLGSRLVEALLTLNQSLALPGSAQMTGLSPLLLGLMGILGAGFAWARLRAPAGQLWLQALAVKVAAALLITVAVANGASAILLVIAVADGVAAVVLAMNRPGR